MVLEIDAGHIVIPTGVLTNRRSSQRLSLCFALLNQAFRKERRLKHPPHPGLQSPDGFTLIEMMLVVTILGILVSMV
ncbi:MAG: type II secretion system protein [Nitrospirae bacterium]|nr:MAG: type II secretion system protein [Nitrospirota bacterium]